ncbi:cobyric acid synthase [Proteinivorax hydrogeniformans]|uniref:Cobyric acid synthase n=1 Tax=Proteinivorax hydrogeniformans TaxID=1826727 RepID=A0AAU8HVE0_9FIRM
MNRKSIMVQGTASSAGKSLACTAICRILTDDGFNVAPFKSQNMSLNSYITSEGHEIGRAQVMQAEACKKNADVRMNPILLKPSTNQHSQVVINGIVKEHMGAREYFKYKPTLKKLVKQSFESLSVQNDVVVIEGAGSPAEINLKSEDIVNMGMAKLAKSPVLLIADIDKGGVFASIYGTIMLLDEEERKMIKGIIINKFRGDVELLKPGLSQIEELVNIPVLGVIPYFNLNLEDEDSATDWSKYDDDSQGDLDIAIIKLPKISNFTDFNPFKLYKDVNVRFVDLEKDLGNPDLIIIPGTKSTIEDFKLMKTFKMVEKIKAAHKRGSYVFGICGGYQMLGDKIFDFDNVECDIKEVNGLGLLPITTEFKKQKTTTLTEGEDNIFGCKIKGYEIHMGSSKISPKATPFANINRRNNVSLQKGADGAVNNCQTVYGTYLHGIFDNSLFTRSFLNKVRISRGKEVVNDKVESYWEHKEKELNKLADIVRENVDITSLYKIIEEGLDD